VLRAGTATVPRLDRAEKATPYRDQIVALFTQCRGNLVRVHERHPVPNALRRRLEFACERFWCPPRAHELDDPLPVFLRIPSS
jgi:hypothetical protein